MSVGSVVAGHRLIRDCYFLSGAGTVGLLPTRAAFPPRNTKPCIVQSDSDPSGLPREASQGHCSFMSKPCPRRLEPPGTEQTPWPRLGSHYLPIKLTRSYLKSAEQTNKFISETSAITPKRCLRRDHIMGLALRRPSGVCVCVCMCVWG